MSKVEEQAAEQATPVVSEIVKMKREVEGDELQNDHKRDQALAQLAGLPGWRVLREYIDGRVKTLRGLLEAEWADPGMTDEQVGIRFRAASLAAEELEKVKQRVEAPHKAGLLPEEKEK
jgi:hypothetical protein